MVWCNTLHRTDTSSPDTKLGEILHKLEREWNAKVDMGMYSKNYFFSRWHKWNIHDLTVDVLICTTGPVNFPHGCKRGIWDSTPPWGIIGSWLNIGIIGKWLKAIMQLYKTVKTFIKKIEKKRLTQLLIHQSCCKTISPILPSLER